MRLLVPGDLGYLKALFYRIGACDTTSTTLSYLCWELSRRSDIAKKLQAELDAAMPDCKTIPDISILQDLPYLTAFIKEGFGHFTLSVYLATEYCIFKVFVFTVLLQAYLSVLCHVPVRRRICLRPSI